jgi:hypothetical protein
MSANQSIKRFGIQRRLVDELNQPQCRDGLSGLMNARRPFFPYVWSPIRTKTPKHTI